MEGGVRAERSRIVRLPPGWREVLDPPTGMVYYWHMGTGETRWRRPDAAEPALTASQAGKLAVVRKARRAEGATGAPRRSDGWVTVQVAPSHPGGDTAVYFWHPQSGREWWPQGSGSGSPSERSHGKPLRVGGASRPRGARGKSDPARSLMQAALEQSKIADGDIERLDSDGAGADAATVTDEPLQNGSGRRQTERDSSTAHLRLTHAVNGSISSPSTLANGNSQVEGRRRSIPRPPSTPPPQDHAAETARSSTMRRVISRGEGTSWALDREPPPPPPPRVSAAQQRLLSTGTFTAGSKTESDPEDTAAERKGAEPTAPPSRAPEPAAVVVESSPVAESGAVAPTRAVTPPLQLEVASTVTASVLASDAVQPSQDSPPDREADLQVDQVNTDSSGASVAAAAETPQETAEEPGRPATPEPSEAHVEPAASEESHDRTPAIPEVAKPAPKKSIEALLRDDEIEVTMVEEEGDDDDDEDRAKPAASILLPEKEQATDNTNRSASPAAAAESSSVSRTSPGPPPSDDGQSNYSSVDEFSMDDGGLSPAHRHKVTSRSPRVSVVDVPPAPELAADEAFRDAYSLNKTLGSGAFATVRSAVHRETGREFACKIVKRSSLDEDAMANLATEVRVLASLHHPHIVHLLAFHGDEDNFYLLMEMLRGGELLHRIVKKSTYSEKEARDVIRTLTSAVSHLHDKGVTHRDIKPENLLYVSDAEDSALKLVDFGFATEATQGAEVCGTPQYIAPEMLQATHTHGPGVDIWALGIIFYILLAGYPPFYSDNEKELLRQIREDKVEFDDEIWSAMSASARDLVSRMLAKDPKSRISAPDVLRHPFLRASRASLGSSDLSHTRKQMMRFNARRRLKAGMAVARSIGRMKVLLGATRSAASLAATAIVEEEEEEEEEEEGAGAS